MREYPEERLLEQLVTYTLEMDGQLYVFEHVPARINVETDERYFSPATVERIQKIVWEGHAPTRTMQVPVFDFAA